MLESASIGTFRNTVDRWRVAFYAPTATIGNATTAYTTSGEISSGLGSYTAGGILIVPDVSSFVDGLVQKVKVDFADIEITGSPTFTAGFALLYNESTAKGNPALAWWSFVPTVTASGTTFSFGPRDADNMAPIVFG